jgi:hypothetical protein
MPTPNENAPAGHGLQPYAHGNTTFIYHRSQPARHLARASRKLQGVELAEEGGPFHPLPVENLGGIMKRTWRCLLLALSMLAVLSLVYVRTHWRYYRLAFMEAHTHCIKGAGLALEQYAGQNQGRFPFHPKGYGNALLFLEVVGLTNSSAKSE